jgi:aryl-alcohol dehydrogenase-like predicted oxidoreductase
VSVPLIWPRTVEQLDQAMAALDVALEQHVLDQLDKIFPGPDARAPEAYAW